MSEPNQQHEAWDFAGRLFAAALAGALYWWLMPKLFLWIVGYIEGEPTVWDQIDNFLFDNQRLLDQAARLFQVLSTAGIVGFMLVPWPDGKKRRQAAVEEP
jgi:hypothetical protein